MYTSTYGQSQELEDSLGGLVLLHSVTWSLSLKRGGTKVNKAWFICFHLFDRSPSVWNPNPNWPFTTGGIQQPVMYGMNGVLQSLLLHLYITSMVKHTWLACNAQGHKNWLIHDSIHTISQQTLTLFNLCCQQSCPSMSSYKSMNSPFWCQIMVLAFCHD